MSKQVVIQQGKQSSSGICIKCKAPTIGYLCASCGGGNVMKVKAGNEELGIMAFVQQYRNQQSQLAYPQPQLAYPQLAYQQLAYQQPQLAYPQHQFGFGMQQFGSQPQLAFKVNGDYTYARGNPEEEREKIKKEVEEMLKQKEEKKYFQEQMDKLIALNIQTQQQLQQTQQQVQQLQQQLNNGVGRMSGENPFAAPFGSGKKYSESTF